MKNSPLKEKNETKIQCQWTDNSSDHNYILQTENFQHIVLNIPLQKKKKLDHLKSNFFLQTLLYIEMNTIHQLVS